MTAQEINLNLELWPRQLQAFNSESNEMLFGGATEGGKSHFARILLISACLAVPGLQCVLVRKKYDDILKNHVEGPTGFRAILSDLVKLKLVQITNDGVYFPKGSIIAFQHCQDERQFTSAQGVEKHLLVIDEATQISERLIRFFRTWVRMPKEMQAQLPAEWQKKLPGILYTANPIGPSVPFFRRNFVDALPNEEIKLISGFRRQYLLSRYTDNLSVDKDAHVGRLEGLGDKALADALDLGKWDALTGEFYPEWDAERHVVKDFIPPQHWFRFRSFDWGTADPASVYFVAVSDGEPFTDNEGNKRWFPRGALVFYNEWYICDDGHSRLEDNHPDKGRRLSNKEMAEGIIHRSEFEHRNVPTLTDSKPFQDVGGDGPAKVFEAHGVPLTQADTSRVAGWSQLRSRLIGEDFGYTDSDGKPIKLPLIYFCSCCKYAQDYIPSLPRHPSESKREDAAEHGEATHACDAVRYACMAHANLLVKDRIQPMQARIMKELAAQKPTIKKIAKGLGHGYFG